MTMFVIAEVHPFADGNGRTARIAMNAYLTQAGLSRILIPTVYREDYVLPLRALSRSAESLQRLSGGPAELQIGLSGERGTDVDVSAMPKEDPPAYSRDAPSPRARATSSAVAAAA